ncbi:hypothetical protein [Bacillus atrophaeus]
MVNIEGIDEQACGGTRVKNNPKIGYFSIIKIQKRC